MFLLDLEDCFASLNDHFGMVRLVVTTRISVEHSFPCENNNQITTSSKGLVSKTNSLGF